MTITGLDFNETTMKEKNLSTCGIDCDACIYKIEGKCEGCKICAPKGQCIFGGRCDLHDCATEKKLPHCGKCNAFPCTTLQEWASSENPERIDNLSALNQSE